MSRIILNPEAISKYFSGDLLSPSALIVFAKKLYITDAVIPANKTLRYWEAYGRISWGVFSALRNEDFPIKAQIVSMSDIKILITILW